jgi:hypothetical protein
MQAIKTVFSPLVLAALTLSLTACVSAPHSHQPADQMATTVLGPIATWNPVPGAANHPGSAASGRLDEENGHIHTRQTFEVWNYSGEHMPEDVRQRHQLPSYNSPHRRY